MTAIRILITEDEAIVAKDLQQRLRDMGYEVLGICARGEDAVVMAEKHRPDLCLMDIHLAGEMDGIQAAQQIRSRFSIPVVYLTAYADESTLHRAKVTEPFGYILKPFEERDLQTTIEIGLYRHRAEVALRESEGRYRTLVESSQGLICSHDLDGNILSINAAGARALGAEPGDLLDRNLSVFLSAVSRNHFDAYLQTLRTSSKGEGVLVVRGPDGDRSLLYRNVRLDEEGKRPYVLVYAQDITDRERADEALRQQNEYLTALHVTTLGLMRRMDRQELLHSIISHAARLVGTDHGYVFYGEPDREQYEMRVGIGLYESFVGTLARLGVGLAGQVLQTGNPLVVDDYREWPDRLPDPSRDILRAVAGVPLKAGDHVIGVIGLAYTDDERRFGPNEVAALNRFAELASLALENARLNDALQVELAERRRAEEETRQAEDFTSQIIENIPHAISVKDATSGRYLRWNRAGVDLLGLARDELIGKTDAEVFSPEEAQIIYRNDREVLGSGRPVDIAEQLIDTRARGRRVLHTKRIPIAGRDGQPAYVLGISEDITEARDAQEQRRALERKLQETQKLESLGVLAGGIAHDFNNLLVSVLGNVGLVLLDLEPGSPIREPIEQIKIAAQRAADLTKQMLAYSGKGKFVMQPLNLNGVIQEMTQLLRVSISKSAALKMNLANELPTIEADATQVRQIIMNLIVNASDAIGNKSGVISVSTGSVYADHGYLSQAFMAPDLKEGNYVYLEVADTGCGMDEDTKKKIFDPFFTTKFTGRGLGLAAVLGILRGHDGAIKVYSEVGQGSVFRILLPVKGQNGASRPEERRPIKMGKGMILVIDDEEVVRIVTKRMLERFGYTPLVAEDGFTGLDILGQHKDEIGCILLDMTMPRLTGEDTFREIQKIKPGAKVILMSGYTEMEANRRFAMSGLAGFMQKPYTPEDLQDRIQAALQSTQPATT